MSEKTSKSSRTAFEKLSQLCDTMDAAAERNDYDAFMDAYEAADKAVSYHDSDLSEYEDAIVFAFDAFDSFKHQDEYMAAHADEWSYEHWCMEQRTREKYACGTQSQQRLIQHVYGMDEETVHEDLELWRRFINLYEQRGRMMLAHNKVA